MAETVHKPLSLKEAAAFLKLKPSYIYQLVHYRRLTAYKPGGKLLIFKKEDLECYAFRNKKASSFELLKQADNILTGKTGRRV
jgi:excisionase family DNA binding protein